MLNRTATEEMKQLQNYHLNLVHCTISVLKSRGKKLT